jgi:hypothetical protein
MNQPGLILDYASPRKRSQFRLASKSLLETQSVGNELQIREWMGDRGVALWWIVASSLMVGNLVRVTVVNRDWNGLSLFVIAAWIATLFPVIHQTWTQTLLRIGDGTMRLKMGGPFRKRAYAWSLDDVEVIQVIGTQFRENAPVLAELEILAVGTPPVRLFTDHPQADVVRVANDIERAVGRLTKEVGG